ncbi:MAG: alpha/beta hydrolase [Cytophagales bacterium]|nr:alpha/beta hydrolase [Cytophagales bacterium]
MNMSTSAKAVDRTRMSFSLRDQRTLSYAIYGPEEGIPFIMFHGTPGSRISMDDEILHEIGVKMIYPERPGYGLSTANPDATLMSWVADVQALLDHLRIEKFALGGGSGGGPYAMACAAALSDRMSSLTLISSAAPQDIPGIRKEMAWGNVLGYFLSKYAPFLMRYASRSFAKSMLNDPEKAFDQSVMKQVGDTDRRTILAMKENGTFQVILDHCREAYINGAEGHIADMRILSKDWKINYDKIDCPIHIWHGEEDTLSPIQGARAMATFLPQAEPHYVTGAGHLLMEIEAVFQDILISVKENFIDS